MTNNRLPKTLITRITTTIKVLPLTIGIVSLLTLSLATPTHTLAQSIGLSITPPVVEILMKPNKSFVQAFTIQNQGETTYITPRIRQIMPIDEFGHSTVLPTSLDPTTIPLTITLENADRTLDEPFLLEAGASTQLVLRIESASINGSEDVYLALYLEHQSTPTPGYSQSSPSIAALLLTTVTSDSNIPIDLDIEGFEPPLIHDSWLPLELQAKIVNNSKIMFRPKGVLKITNLRGHTVLEKPLFPNLVLGNSERAILLTEGEEIDNPTSTPQSFPLSWKPSFWDIGPHMINITIYSRTGKLLVEKTRTIWVLPIQALVYIGVLAIMLSLLITHRNNNKND